MQFGSRDRFYTLVVRRSVWVHGPNGDRQATEPLRAIFKENFFDSEKAQEEFRWTDEERQEVERAIMEHGDFMRGLYPAEQVPTPEEDADRPLVCVTMVERNGTWGLCGAKAGEDELCEEHRNVVQKALAAAGAD